MEDRDVLNSEILERLTWEQMQEKYPDQWLGLIDVEYKNNDGATVKSGVVKYVNKKKGELTERVLDGEIIARHTNPDGYLQLGMVGVR